jgi:hypothetical protein
MLVVGSAQNAVNYAHSLATQPPWNIRTVGHVSVPGEVWRCISNAGHGEAELLIICAGDERKRPRFTEAIQEAVRAGGVALDASDYLCRSALMPVTSQWLK